MDAGARRAWSTHVAYPAAYVSAKMPTVSSTSGTAMSTMSSGLAPMVRPWNTNTSTRVSSSATVVTGRSASMTARRPAAPR